MRQAALRRASAAPPNSKGVTAALKVLARAMSSPKRG